MNPQPQAPWGQIRRIRRKAEKLRLIAHKNPLNDLWYVVAPDRNVLLSYERGMDDQGAEEWLQAREKQAVRSMREEAVDGDAFRVYAPAACQCQVVRVPELEFEAWKKVDAQAADLVHEWVEEVRAGRGPRTEAGGGLSYRDIGFHLIEALPGLFRDARQEVRLLEGAAAALGLYVQGVDPRDLSEETRTALLSWLSVYLPYCVNQLSHIYEMFPAREHPKLHPRMDKFLTGICRAVQDGKLARTDRPN
jgi:hypothetical protein